MAKLSYLVLSVNLFVLTDNPPLEDYDFLKCGLLDE
jgi:hypothetical protein